MVSGLSRLSRCDVSQTDKVTGEPVPLSPKWRGAQVIEGRASATTSASAWLHSVSFDD